MKLNRLFYPILLSLMLMFPALSGATTSVWDEPAYTVSNLDMDKPVMPMVNPEAFGGDATPDLFSIRPASVGLSASGPLVYVIRTSEWNHPPMLAKVTEIWKPRHWFSDH